MIRKPDANGMRQVHVYDPAIKRKRYVGTYKTHEEALIAEDQHGKMFRGETGDLRRCPGCRKLFIPDDDWQKRCSPRCEANVKKREHRRRTRREDDHWVYTALNADMQVIYVGLTSTGLRRHKEHGREMAWWPQVAFMRIQHFATRDEALAAEAAGIARHNPPFNTLGILPNGEIWVDEDERNAA